MKKIITIFFLIFLNVGICSTCFSNLSGPSFAWWVKLEPLLLTPLIEQNKIEEARNASEVHYADFENLTSYSGYFTVDKVYNSNLFFWFFPAFHDYENAPVILGHPGMLDDSSLSDMLLEYGPLRMKAAAVTELRHDSWAESHSLIFIDSPANSGFSSTDDRRPTNLTQVGEDMYNALQQFFTLFPEIRKNELFIAGKILAGKYIPGIAYSILKNNPSAKLKINLQGVAIGNGLIDPEHQFIYGDHLYQLGLIDGSVRNEFRNYEQRLVKYIQEKNFEKANEMFIAMVDGGPFSLLINATAFKIVFNYICYYNCYFSVAEEFMVQLFKKVDFLKALHVGTQGIELRKSKVPEVYPKDITQSVSPWVSELLSSYRFLIFNGQLDLYLSYSSVVHYLQNLDFSSAEEYRNTAQRYQWYVGKELAGYVKQAGNLTEVMVRNAGIKVVLEKPKWGLDLIYKFTRNIPIHTKP